MGVRHQAGALEPRWRARVPHAVRFASFPGRADRSLAPTCLGPVPPWAEALGFQTGGVSCV